MLKIADDETPLYDELVEQLERTRPLIHLARALSDGAATDEPVASGSATGLDPVVATPGDAEPLPQRTLPVDESRALAS
ncbi:hypothetical protein [Oerskovia flava]|uniref:hypothetical protein n=1 Tax=Oerskovia flava TaxID=2986422 RepID=UPI0022409131|nr:hypothetical protein [Oerskovia sp. JB1-3-2]